MDHSHHRVRTEIGLSRHLTAVTGRTLRDDCKAPQRFGSLPPDRTREAQRRLYPCCKCAELVRSSMTGCLISHDHAGVRSRSRNQKAHAQFGTDRSSPQIVWIRDKTASSNHSNISVFPTIRTCYYSCGAPYSPSRLATKHNAALTIGRLFAVPGTPRLRLWFSPFILPNSLA